MAKYQGISSSLFDEPEYKDPTELLIAMYIMVNRDMAGVCPIKENIVAASCRTSVAKLRRTLKKFVELGKLKVSSTACHVWWKSGINHSLYKGNFSPNQLLSVVKLLSKWDQSKLFGDNFALEVVQLYANKYKLEIPYPKKGDTHSDQSEAEADIQSESDMQAETPDLENPGNVQDFPTGAYEQIRIACFNKFGKDLRGEDCDALIRECPDIEILMFIIKRVILGEKEILNPTGFLIKAISEMDEVPGRYLSDDDCDARKKLLRQISDRNY